jgi:hypothetical protein
MAKRMRPGRQAAGWQRRRLAAGSVWLFLAASALPGFAAALRDPTEPPQVRAGHPGHTAAARLPVLESVLLLPGYKAAIIDGQTVMLGSTFNGARLVALTPQTARLRKGARIRVLHLAPAAAPGLEAAPPAAALEKTK